MDEYISKEYVINKCKEHRELYISAWGDFSAMPKEDKATCDAYATCWSDVVNAPPADVQPVKSGHWENTNTPNHLRCSKCEVIHFIAQYPHGEINFCPNCGARMDGETNG